MKSSWTLAADDPDEAYVRDFDRSQIDNPNPRAYTRLAYLDRLHRMLSSLESRLEPGSSVADVGCAQGNLALLLAESGHRVDAYDLNPSFLRYASRKHEHGDLNLIPANIFDQSDTKQYDAIVLAELVEHVAHPQDLMALALQRLRVGGLLLVTTPNGRYIRERLPEYEEAVRLRGIEAIEREQFGPGGEHHLFAYSMRSLLRHIPDGAEVVASRYLSTGLFNSHAQRVLDSRLGPLYCRLAAFVSALPWLRERLNTGLLLIAVRRG